MRKLRARGHHWFFRVSFFFSVVEFWKFRVTGLEEETATTRYGFVGIMQVFVHFGFPASEGRMLRGRRFACWLRLVVSQGLGLGACRAECAH